MKLSWNVENKAEATYLKVCKDWDLHKANEFSYILNKDPYPGQSIHFVVDLSDVDYIDSMALGFLISLKNKYKTEGGQVMLFSPSVTIQKILKQSGLLQIFPVYYSKEDLDLGLKTL